MQPSKSKIQTFQLSHEHKQGKAMTATIIWMAQWRTKEKKQAANVNQKKSKITDRKWELIKEKALSPSLRVILQDTLVLIHTPYTNVIFSLSLSLSLVSLGPTLAVVNHINHQVLKPEMLEEKMIKDHFHVLLLFSLFFFRYWYRYGYRHRHGLSPLNRHSTTSTSKPKSKKQSEKKRDEKYLNPQYTSPTKHPKGKQGEEIKEGKGEFFENCGLLFFIGNKGS